MEKKCTPQEEKFLREILRGCDQVEAYTRAGYKGNKNSLAANSSRLLKRPHMQKRLKAMGALAAKRNDLSVDYVIRKLRAIADGNLQDYLSWSKEHGLQMKASDKLPTEKAGVIKEFSLTPRGLRIKLHDKVKAVELLGRYLGIFRETFDVNLSGNVEVDVTEIDALVERRLGGKAKSVFK